jgi:dCMP deaminase
MTKQESLDKWMMEIAIKTAMKSKCVSKHVGCVLVKEGRIISQGYNGTPEGNINCNEYYNGIRETTIEHKDFNKRFEIHAEMNAILWAVKNGINISGSTCYVNIQPCWDCSKNMIQAGIKRIVYLTDWEKMTAEEKNIQREFLLDNGIELTQIII